MTCCLALNKQDSMSYIMKYISIISLSILSQCLTSKPQWPERGRKLFRLYRLGQHPANEHTKGHSVTRKTRYKPGMFDPWHPIYNWNAIGREIHQPGPALHHL